jgi:hypothetical protein
MKFACNVMLNQIYLHEIPMQCHVRSKNIWMKSTCNVMPDQKYVDEISMQCHAESNLFA